MIKTVTTGSIATIPLAASRISGDGTTAIRFAAVETKEHLVEVNYSGSDNYILWLKDEQGLSLDLLVNEIGAFRGNRSAPLTNGAYILDITTTGPWTIVISPPVRLIDQASNISATVTSEPIPETAPLQRTPPSNLWATMRPLEETLIPTQALPTNPMLIETTSSPPVRATTSTTNLTPIEMTPVPMPTTFSLRQTFQPTETDRTWRIPASPRMDRESSWVTTAPSAKPTVRPSEARTPLQQRTWGRG